MMYYQDESGTTRYTLQDFEPTFRQKMGAANSEAWAESLGPVFMDRLEAKKLAEESEKLSIEDTRAYAESLGGFYTPDRPLNKQQIEFLTERQREITKIRDVRSRTPWDMASPLRGLSMFGTGIADPVNLATAFVPWTRGLTALRGLAATGTTARQIAARTALGAADAAISTAALELPYAIARQSLGDDYGAMDSVVNIAFGSAFGGGVHAIGGVGSALYRKYGPPSKFDVEKPPLLEAVTTIDRATAENLAAKNLIDKLEAPAARQARDADIQAKIKQIEELQAQRVAPVEVDIAELTEQFKAEGLTGRKAKAAAKKEAEKIQAQNNAAQTQNNSRIDEQIAEIESEVETLRRVDADIEQIREGAIPERYRPQIDQEIEQIKAPQADAPPSAAQLAATATPEQRQSALNTAVAQVVSGKNVDVAPIFEGQNTPSTQAAIEKSFSPENSRSIDDAASQQADTQAGDKGWATLEDARERMAEADAILNDVLKAGDQAYKYSRGKVKQPSTKADIEQAARESFGDTTKALIERGQVEIVGSVKDIPDGPHPGDVKAATAPDGKVYIVAENVTPDQIRGLMLHEVGVHVGMREMLGDDLFADVLNQVDDAIKRGDEWALDAARQVPEDTPRQYMAEEQLAYLVESQPELPLVKRIIAAVRAWLVKTFGASLNLNPADLQALAALSLRSVGRIDRPIADQYLYSRGKVQDPSTIKNQLAVFDAEIERAQKQGAAIRAAADKLSNETQALDAMRAASPDLGLDEAKQLLKDLQSNVGKMQRTFSRMEQRATAESDVDALQTDAMKAADEMANNLEMAAVIERRNAAFNLAVEAKAKSFIAQFDKPGLDVEGFFGLLVGSERARESARNSVDAEYKGYRAQWIQGMLTDLEKAGVTEAFSKGLFDRDAYDALYKMGKGEDVSNLPKEAVQIAEIVSKYQEAARNTRNRFGAWIGDLQGYITRQSHDMFKLRDAGEEQWINDTIDKLDLPKMREMGVVGDDVRGMLSNVYKNLASGVHHKPEAGEVDKVAFTGSRNLAKKESVSRVLHFKDGISAFEYNQKYGQGMLKDSVIFGLERSAQSTALLKKLGTNPESMLKKLMDDYEESLSDDPIRKGKFHQKRNAIEIRLKQVNGETDIPVNVTAAKISAFARAWKTFTSLGGVIGSAVTDLPNIAADMRFSQGKNLLQGTGESFGMLFQSIKGDRKKVLNSLGVFHESVLGGVLNRFDASNDTLGGKTSAVMNAYFKLNLLAPWTEKLRDGASLQIASYIGDHSEVSFSDLPSDIKRVFNSYGIDEPKWNVIRLATEKADDGRTYSAPGMFSRLPDSVFSEYLKSIGREPIPAAIQNARDDLAQQMRVMFIDRAHHAVPEPNAKNRATMLQGQRPGTFWGETARFIGQFKSFSFAMVQNVLGREVYGRGYDTVGEFLRKGWKGGLRSDMMGFAYYIGLTTMFGYMAMSVKDMMKGREPRDPRDPKTFLASMAQGGGLGLYGDFLFGEFNRFGRSLTSSIAGPVLGELDTMADLWTRLKTGDDLGSATFRAMINNTPFLNLFYLRITLDYLILYGIQDALNPGFLRRMERRIQRENNQEFLFPPSEYATQF